MDKYYCLKIYLNHHHNAHVRYSHYFNGIPSKEDLNKILVDKFDFKDYDDLCLGQDVYQETRYGDDLIFSLREIIMNDVNVPTKDRNEIMF